MKNKRKYDWHMRAGALLLCVVMIFGIVFGSAPIAAQASASKKKVTLSNPKKNSSGTTTWDCVWFGSYPQTEVVSAKDTRRISALRKMNKSYTTEYDMISSAEYKKIVNARYNSNGDATVNGVKYRRIKKSDASFTCIKTFDYYLNMYTSLSSAYTWTDSTSYHYFRYEPIKWRVLSVNGKDAFLMAAICLDCQLYQKGTDYVSTTWATSSVRSWLNGYGASKNVYGTNYTKDNFIDSAFDSSEQKAIKKAKVVNKADKKVCSPINEGKDTYDRIYLLSGAEVSSRTYGFSGYKKVTGTYSGKSYTYYYYNTDKGRRLLSSTYAKAMGAVAASKSSNYDTVLLGATNWFLRSHGNEGSNYYTTAGDTGGLDSGAHGDDFTQDYSAICPVLHLNLSYTGVYSYAGTVDSDGNAVEKQNGTAKGIRRGDVITDTVTDAYYKVTSASGTRTVTYIQPIRSKSKVTVKSKIKVKGVTYRVTAIAGNAFRGRTGLKSLTIGKTVKKIGAYAFYGCKNLKSITVNSSSLKSSTIGKNAFKKVSSSVSVKVPSKKYKAYKKLLISKGISKKASFTK